MKTATDEYGKAMAKIIWCLATVLVLGGCAILPSSYEPPTHVPAEWLTAEHIDAIINGNPRPEPIREFETTKQYKARIKTAQAGLERTIELPVVNSLISAYDPDKERVRLFLNTSVGHMTSWYVVNGVGVYDSKIVYPDVSFPLPIETARSRYDPARYRLILVGTLRDYPDSYLAIAPKTVLIYDVETRQILASE
jgi:hypothetical protein